MPVIMPEGKGELEDLALSSRCSSLQVTCTTFTQNSLARMSHAAPLKLQRSQDVRPTKCSGGEKLRFSRRCGLWLTRKLDLGSCRLLTPSLDLRICIPLAFPVPGTAQGHSLETGAAETIWVVYVTEPSYSLYINFKTLGFPGGSVVKNLPANAGDTGLIPGLGRSHIP